MYLNLKILLKATNHHLSLQKVVIFLQQYTQDHRSPCKDNDNEKVENVTKITKI